jgi:hypothetical protein
MIRLSRSRRRRHPCSYLHPENRFLFLRTNPSRAISHNTYPPIGSIRLLPTKLTPSTTNPLLLFLTRLPRAHPQHLLLLQLSLVSRRPSPSPQHPTPITRQSTTSSPATTISTVASPISTPLTRPSPNEDSTSGVKIWASSRFLKRFPRLYLLVVPFVSCPSLPTSRASPPIPFLSSPCNLAFVPISILPPSVLPITPYTPLLM